MDDLTRLCSEGFNVQLRDGYLIVEDIPYVTADREVRRGRLVMPAALAGDTLVTPPDHTTHFGGSEPCNASGQPLANVINSPMQQELVAGAPTDYYFSAKPQAGNYTTYYEKVTTYVELLTRWARVIDPSASAQADKAPDGTDTSRDSPFMYPDSASSRAGTTALNTVFAGLRLAILGLGGTGSHILDLVAKTPVAEIHLYDADVFQNHNAFRAPGAAKIEDLEQSPLKVDYWAARYGLLKRGIVPHRVVFEANMVNELIGFDFVFVAVDDDSDRVGITSALEAAGLSFIDVGMGVTDTGAGLTGMLRVSASTPDKRAVIRHGGAALDEYARNIQIGDLNALNAALAVVHWKRHLGFYADMSADVAAFVYPLSDNTIAEID